MILAHCELAHSVKKLRLKSKSCLQLLPSQMTTETRTLDLRTIAYHRAERQHSRRTKILEQLSKPRFFPAFEISYYPPVQHGEKSGKWQELSKPGKNRVLEECSYISFTLAAQTPIRPFGLLFDGHRLCFIDSNQITITISAQFRKSSQN